MTTEHDTADRPASPLEHLVRQMRDSRERFIFQGGSKFAIEIADEIERLSVNAETIEFAQSASRLLYGFMLDCNSVGVHAAGENLARGLKHRMSVLAQREVDAANLTPNT